MARRIRVVSYLPRFYRALRRQLLSDEQRHGDEWLHRTRSGQVTRIIDRINTYNDEYAWGDIEEGEFPWLKVAGMCVIGWVRDIGDPDLWPE